MEIQKRGKTMDEKTTGGTKTYFLKPNYYVHADFYVRSRRTFLVPNIQSSRHLSESNDGVVPWHSCPPLKIKNATQAGYTPFGGFREQITKVKEHENEKKKNIHLLIIDPKSSNSFLNLWNQPNPESKNNTLHGRHRQTVIESTGGRRFTPEEVQQCRASLPKFQCFNESCAAIDYANGAKTTRNNRRQVTTVIRGLDMTTQEKLDSNKHMSWLGGQVSLQSQSFTGGFNKIRDVVSPSYYAKLISEKEAAVK